MQKVQSLPILQGDGGSWGSRNAEKRWTRKFLISPGSVLPNQGRDRLPQRPDQTIIEMPFKSSDLGDDISLSSQDEAWCQISFLVSQRATLGSSLTILEGALGI